MRYLFLSALFILVPLGASPLPRMDDHHGQGKEERKEEKRERKEHRKGWKNEDQGRWHHFHERDEDNQDDRDWDFEHPRHRHIAPPWMDNYWRPEERHYAALIPGDPSRVYILVGNRWVLRRVRDSRFRPDVEGAWQLPDAPAPAPLPRLGLHLKIVLFD